MGGESDQRGPASAGRHPQGRNEVEDLAVRPGCGPARRAYEGARPPVSERKAQWARIDELQKQVESMMKQPL